MFIKKRFKDKVVIITGAAQGIGYAIAIKFAKEGAKLALLDINLDKLKESAKKIKQATNNLLNVLVIKTDVSDQRSVQNAFLNAIKEWGKVDVLVNNAGILYPSLIEDITEDEWDQVIDVNLKGVFLCSQEAFRNMKGKEGGVIINIASLAGKKISASGGVHYTASKAGVLGLTRHFANEVGPYNIRVNAICPGLIETDMVKHRTTDEIKMLADKLPLKRIGKADEVANLVTYLASDEASFITGAEINIGGGSELVPLRQR
jgi:3-oxoacyl-[acyl-carrier protein] reductase